MKNRLEFLLPNITSERKLKWLANAELEWQATDYDITQYTFEQYLEKMITDNDIKCVDQDNHDCTREHHYKHYMDLFFNGKETRMCQLDKDLVRWDNNNIDLLATYLSSHPLLVPYFLQDNAINIVGNFFGEYSISTLGFEENRYIREKSKRKYLYKHANIIAKYRLSLFIAVINKLLDLDVNIGEYEFKKLEKNSTFSKMKNEPKWNQKIIDGISEEGYQRMDGQHFSKEQMINFLNFNNIFEFLNKVIDLTEVECYIDFDEETKMLDPDNIIPLKEHCNGIRPLTTHGKMVEMSEVCQKIQRKIKKVQISAEDKVLERKMAELANTINDYITEPDSDIRILPRINEFYELLDGCNQTTKDAWLDTFEDFLMEHSLKEKYIQSEQSKEKQVQKEEFQMIMEKFELLNKRVGIIERKLENVEKILKDYIEHGGAIPLAGELNMSNQELAQILANITPTTFGGKVRKTKLISSLTGGLIGLLLGTVLTTSEVQPTAPEDPVSITSEIAIEEEPESIQRPTSLYELMKVLPVTQQGLTEEELEALTLDVIRGNYGNGEERKENLTEDGYNYDYIQSLVNEVYQNSQVDEKVLRK